MNTQHDIAEKHDLPGFADRQQARKIRAQLTRHERITRAMHAQERQRLQQQAREQRITTMRQRFVAQRIK